MILRHRQDKTISPEKRTARISWGATLAASFLATAVAGGCAIEKYRPAPLAPIVTARKLESRRLTDPGLKQFLEVNFGHPVSPWPLDQWELRTLTLAALYFNPNVEIAREQFRVAQGGIITAGEHPNPSIGLTPGVPSPWLFDFPFVFPIETHGKRRLRIEQATKLSSAARFALAEAQWRVASDVRKTLLAYQVARANLALEQSSEVLETTHVRLLETLLSTGEGPRPTFETARLALANTRFQIRVDDVQVATTKAALAGAIAIPINALDGVRIVWPDIEQLPSVASLSPQRIVRDAVLNRLDVRRALDQYAAADAQLRLEIARQYPNFNIGPGYQYEEGNNFFTIPFSMVLPIRNRNQGPIAQAEALRKEAAANFLAVQARAIAQSQQALAAYRSTFAELNQANEPLRAQRRRVTLAEQAVTAGEADNLELNTLQLENVVYARQHLVALAQAQAALGALEDSVEKPLGPEVSILPSRAAASTTNGPKEAAR